MPFAMTLYGRALTEAISRGGLDEMRELAVVSAFLKRTQGSDLESEEAAEWDEAHKLLLSAIAEKTSIKLAKEDVVAVRDGLIVLDSLDLARALKPLLSQDAEGWYFELKIGYK